MKGISLAILALPSRELLDSLDRDQLLIVETMFERVEWSDYLAPHRSKQAAFEAMEKLQAEEERRYVEHFATTYPERWWYDPESPYYYKYSCFSQHQQHMEDLRYAELVEQSLQWHHIEPLPTPKWKIAADKITTALSGR